jgi:predicted RNase H-like HicB family nuclease
MNTREYNFWFVLRRADDVPGEWVGHCLELDVVTQGNSLHNALNMLGEACFMTLGDDVSSGKDPLDRRAPQSCWDHMFNIAAHGMTVDFKTLDETKVSFVACQVQFRCKFSSATAKTSAPIQETPDLAVPLALMAPAPSLAQPCRC